MFSKKLFLLALLTFTSVLAISCERRNQPMEDLKSIETSNLIVAPLRASDVARGLADAGLTLGDFADIGKSIQESYRTCIIVL